MKKSWSSIIKYCLSAMLLLCSTCAEDKRAKGVDTSSNNQRTNGSETDSSKTVDSDPNPMNDAGILPVCDELEFQSGAALANLLLVVDRSQSIAGLSAGADSATKLQITQDALNLLLLRGQGKIRFGWMQFPNQSACDPGIVEIECADDSVQAIQQKIYSLEPQGNTPTGETLLNAVEYQGLHDPKRNNYVLLLTDGMPTCADSSITGNNELALEGIQKLRSRSIDTFVIGLGQDLNSSDPFLLNQMADLGGRPRFGDIKYYQANTLQELDTIFQDIGDTITSCTLSLSVEPDYPDWLWVYFDKKSIDRDPGHANGFDYNQNSNQINFYGPPCQEVLNDQVSKIKVMMGCSPITTDLKARDRSVD